MVIGIGGGTASGKSTLCALLCERLGENYRVKGVGLDGYMRAELPVMRSPVTGESAPDYNCPDTLDISAAVRDIQGYISSGEYDIIITEGHLALYYAELRALYDLKIFVELDADERMYRRITRNMQRGLDMDEIARYYLDFAKYREKQYALNTAVYADVIANGRNFDGAFADVVMNHIDSMLKNRRG